MNWSEKKVFITGAGGFIGSHLAETLARLGAKVTAMVHYNSMGAKGWLDQSELRTEMSIVLGDVRDPDLISDTLKGQEVVFHLAALIGIPYSYSAPVSYLQTNVEGTVNLLRNIRALDIEKAVFTSTSEVYGTALYVPINEDHPLQGQSPYSASKIGADKMVEAFFRSFALPVVTIRPFNTFGPRQSMRAVIPTIIGQLLHSNVISLGNLSPTRDFNYVSNTVSGFIKAAESNDAIGRTINLGSGREISIGDLVSLIAKLMDKEILVQNAPNRLRPDKSEVERLCADNTLASQLLGWTPEISLEEGLEKTIQWITKNPLRYQSNEFVF